MTLHSPGLKMQVFIWNKMNLRWQYLHHRHGYTTTQDFFLFLKSHLLRIYQQSTGWATPEDGVRWGESKTGLSKQVRKHCINFHVRCHTHNHRHFWAFTTYQIVFQGFACTNSFYSHTKTTSLRYEPLSAHFRGRRPTVWPSWIRKVGDGLSVWIWLHYILTGHLAWLKDKKELSMAFESLLLPKPPHSRKGTESASFLWPCGSH